MKCPCCAFDLIKMKDNKLKVAICKKGCGGVWFDSLEFQKVKQEPKKYEKSIAIIDREKLKSDKQDKKKCPQCKDIVMMCNYFSVKQELEINTCAQCGGVWLQCGTLGEIVKMYKTGQDREKAADEYYSNLVDGVLGPLQSKEKEKWLKIKEIADGFAQGMTSG